MPNYIKKSTDKKDAEKPRKKALKLGKEPKPRHSKGQDARAKRAKRIEAMLERNEERRRKEGKARELETEKLEALKEKLRIGKWHHAVTEVGHAAAALLPQEAARKLSPRGQALLQAARVQEADLAESGGAYDLAEVEEVLRVTRQRVHQLVQQGDLLAVPGQSNRQRYPIIQFWFDPKFGRIAIVEGLEAVRTALGTRNPWAFLNYLANPDPRLDGKVPIDVLRAGHIQQVVIAASHVGEMAP